VPACRSADLLLVVCLAASCTTEFPEAWLRRDGGDRELRADTGRLPDLRPPADLLRPPTVANGQACASNGVCLSGHCADGVCCDSACTAACLACNRPGSVGVCTPVPTGQKPASGTKTCAATAATSCGLDGSCDGLGACRNWPATTICKPQQCSGTKTQLASYCSGGACTEIITGPASSLACDPYICESGLCLQSCKNNSDCSGVTCDQKLCGTLKSIGSPCSAGTECKSGFCGEGVCCNAACTEPCKTCLLEGAKGFCVNVPAGQKPAAAKVCPVDGTPCGKDGACDGGGACRAAPKGTSCGAPACVDGPTSSELSRQVCNGSSSAPACEKQSTPCGAYVCQPSVASCFGRCTDTSQCAPGKSCAGYQCK
jgi:hypothetical protein